MKKITVSVLLLIASLFLIAGARMAAAQVTVPNTRMVPAGYCQMTAVSASTQITAATCVRASFTGTGAGTTLTVSAVTGIIQAGDTIAGTGVPAGTTIVAQLTGTAGGAGTYQTSVATTSSGASLTDGGIPPNATMAFIQAEAQAIRYRDDGGTPTATIGQPLASTGTILYVGTFSNLRIIEQAATAKVNISFYK